MTFFLMKRFKKYVYFIFIYEKRNFHELHFRVSVCNQSHRLELIKNPKYEMHLVKISTLLNADKIHASIRRLHPSHPFFQISIC